MWHFARHFAFSTPSFHLLFQGDHSPASEIGLLLWKSLSQTKTSQQGSGIKMRHLHMPLAPGGFGSPHQVQKRCSCFPVPLKMVLARGTQGGGGLLCRQPAMLCAFCICLLECGSPTSPAALMPPPQKTFELFLGSAVLQSSDVSSWQREVREE